MASKGIVSPQYDKLFMRGPYDYTIVFKQNHQRRHKYFKTHVPGFRLDASNYDFDFPWD